MTDTQIVNAIQARIDGRYDDPDLMLVGALHDRMGDIVEILSMRDPQLPVSTEERERLTIHEAPQLDLVASYDFGVYSIPEGFAVADPIGGADGYYLEGSELEPLLRETIAAHELVSHD